jgi:hypothetical protein
LVYPFVLLRVFVLVAVSIITEHLALALAVAVLLSRSFPVLLLRRDLVAAFLLDLVQQGRVQLISCTRV